MFLTLPQPERGLPAIGADPRQGVRLGTPTAPRQPALGSTGFAATGDRGMFRQRPAAARVRRPRVDGRGVRRPVKVSSAAHRRLLKCQDDDGDGAACTGRHDEKGRQRSCGAWSADRADCSGAQGCRESRDESRLKHGLSLPGLCERSVKALAVAHALAPSNSEEACHLTSGERGGAAVRRRGRGGHHARRLLQFRPPARSARPGRALGP